jgi:hypothetical protein
MKALPSSFYIQNREARDVWSLEDPIYIRPGRLGSEPPHSQHPGPERVAHRERCRWVSPSPSYANSIGFNLALTSPFSLA